MKPILIIATLAVLWPTHPAQAQEKSPHHWQILPENSRIEFKGTQMGASFEGRFGQFDGDIVFDPERPEDGHAEIRIDMTSARTGGTDRDRHLPGSDWFAARAFPQSTYRVGRFEEKEPGRYIAHGDLTIRDITLPVELPFTLTFTEDEDGHRLAAAEGAASIQRLDFGVGGGEWTDTSMVGNTVEVRIFVTARHSGTAPAGDTP